MRASALSIALALALAACVVPVTIATVETTQFNPSLKVDLKASTKASNGEYYRDLVPGPGAALATGQTLSVHYTGWLADGTRFDSNVGGAAFPFVLGAGQVIAGWERGFDGAHVGGTRQLLIPPGLAYGLTGQGNIPGNAVLVFNVQIDSAQVVTVENTQFSPSLNVDLASSTKLPNGEYYRDLVAGSGAAVSAGQMLAVHYTGWLADGSKFDSNVGGGAFSFVLGGGRVIAGWDQGFGGAHVGGTRQLLIPPELGYGLSGSGPIPPNAVLVFSVQIDAAK